IGYDASEMAGFFETLARQGKAAGGEEIPEFLSTHPSPEERNVTVAKLAQEWKSKLGHNNFKVNRDSYLKRIEGLVVGEDPRQGFVENNTFYHPVLKFQFPTPAGWGLLNTPQQVQMAPSDGSAFMKLPLAGRGSLEVAANGPLHHYN